MWMVHPTMQEEELDDTAAAIEKVLAVATR
jgi:hypothetical protein